LQIAFACLDSNHLDVRSTWVFSIDDPPKSSRPIRESRTTGWDRETPPTDVPVPGIGCDTFADLGMCIPGDSAVEIIAFKPRTMLFFLSFCFGCPFFFYLFFFLFFFFLLRLPFRSFPPMNGRAVPLQLRFKRRERCKLVVPVSPAGSEYRHKRRLGDAEPKPVGTDIEKTPIGHVEHMHVAIVPR